MPFKVIGYDEFSFTPKNANEVIDMVQIYVAVPVSNDKGVGYKVLQNDKSIIKISKKKLAALELDPAKLVNKEIEMLFNSWQKVEHITVVS